MALRKKNLEKTVERAAALVEEHFATLSGADEKKARRELEELASVVSRRARGRASRSRRSAGHPAGECMGSPLLGADLA